MFHSLNQLIQFYITNSIFIINIATGNRTSNLDEREITT